MDVHPTKNAVGWPRFSIPWLWEWHQWSESCDGVVDFVYLMWIYNRCRHIDTSTDFGMFGYIYICNYKMIYIYIYITIPKVSHKLSRTYRTLAYITALSMRLRHDPRMSMGRVVEFLEWLVAGNPRDTLWLCQNSY